MKRPGARVVGSERITRSLDAAISTDSGSSSQGACGSGANQSWQVRPTVDGYYQVANRHNGKARDVDGGSGAIADGTRVHPWDYVGGTNQQGRPEPTGTTGQYRFVTRHSAKCLSVDNASTADGARLSQQPCSQSAAQPFTLTTG